MDGADRAGTVAHRGGDAFHRPGPDVADSEDQRLAGLERQRAAAQLGPGRAEQCAVQLGAGEHEAVVIDSDVLEPAGGADYRSWERLFIAQRGSAVVELVARGTPGHSAAQIPPDQRAGMALARAMTALADAHLFDDAAHPVDGTRPTVNIGTMLSGGITPFMHPETITATIEIRVIEGMTMADVHADIRQVVTQAGLADRVEVLAAPGPLDWVPPSPAVRDRRLLNAASVAWRSILGTEPAQGVLLGVTDSCWLGLAGIPTLPAFGCGSLAVAHRPNEWIEEADMAIAIDLTEALARAYSAPGGAGPAAVVLA